jgi:hypothetical protein
MIATSQILDMDIIRDEILSEDLKLNGYTGRKKRDEIQ